MSSSVVGWGLVVGRGLVVGCGRGGVRWGTLGVGWGGVWVRTHNRS